MEKTWSCTLETVTPTALAGANQQRAELRPGTFKSLLRWWWRAGRGRLDREAEGRLFGDAGARNAQARASSFGLRLYRCNQQAKESLLFDRFLKEERKALRKVLRKKDDERIRLAGLDYLSYFLGTPARGVLRPGAQFRVKLSFPVWFEEADQKAVWASLWLLVWFGGLGTRTRRGFGGLRALEADKVDGLHFTFTASKIRDLRDFIESNLEVVRKWLGAKSDSKSPPEYTAIGPDSTRICIYSELESRWSFTLDSIGRDMAAGEGVRDKSYGFRDRRDNAYSEVRRFLNDPNYTPRTVDRAAFGLPLTFYYSSIERRKFEDLVSEALAGQGIRNAGDEARRIAFISRKKDRIAALESLRINRGYAYRMLDQAREFATAHITPANPKYNRRASPLFVRVCQVDNYFAPLYIAMKSQLFSKDEMLRIEQEGTGRCKEVPAPSLNLLDDFFDYIDDSSYGDLWEVEVK